MSPPGKLLIVNGNVFVLLSALVVTEPNDKLFNVLVFPFLSVAVIFTFDELNVVDANASLSVPWNFNEYVFASASYVPSIILSAHTGLSPSTQNSYTFCALSFPVLSFNAPALIVTFTVPPVKLFSVIGNVFVFPLVVAVPNVILLVLTVTPSTVIDIFPEVPFVNVDADEFSDFSSEPTTLNLYVFADSENVPPLISSAHTGAVVSGVNEYVFDALVFPPVSTNAPALIVISIGPPV